MNLERDNLYKLFAIIFLSVFLIGNFSLKTFANNNVGFSNKIQNILGYQPLMESVGASLSLSNHKLYDENELPVLTVGAELFVPSIFCKISELGDELSELLQLYQIDTRFFKFVDQDKDHCLDKDHESQLTWFALDLGQQEWANIQAWDDLSTTALDADTNLIPIGASPLNPFTAGLRIPETAIGKRIGFTYLPVSKTGAPNTGNPVKVWDLSFLFGQETYDSAGYVTQANEGKRLTKIELNASFGEVISNLTQPRIENLIMKGTFLPNFQLTAEYEFIPNSDNHTEDVSRFWWGESGTTASQAYFQNPVYQNTNKSPTLTIDDVAKIYSVTVLPIKKETVNIAGNSAVYYVVGEIESITSDDPTNQFTQPSNISNLKFVNSLNIDNTASATYTFVKGDPDAEDRSEYTWSYIDKKGVSHILVSDKIKESGKVPDSPKLVLEQSGLTLKLEMQPLDQFNRMGKPVLISGNIETAKFIAEPESILFTLNDTDSAAVRVIAQYEAGSKDITLLGDWVSNDESIVIVDDQGNIKRNPSLKTEANSSVTFNYHGRIVTINVNVEALIPRVNNLKLVSLLDNDQLSLFENRGATYEFDDGGKLNSIDRSTYTWRIQNENTTIGSGTIIQSGLVPFPTTSSPIYHSGKVVVLEVTPRDNFNRAGEMQQVEAKLETIRGIEVEPSPIELRRQVNAQLRAYALFTGGRRFINPNGNPTFDGVWSTNAPGISLSYSGYITVNANAPETGTITYKYRTFTVNIPFTVID